MHTLACDNRIHSLTPRRFQVSEKDRFCSVGDVYTLRKGVFSIYERDIQYENLKGWTSWVVNLQFSEILFMEYFLTQSIYGSA